MKKILLSSLLFFVASLGADTQIPHKDLSQLKQIKCKITPHHRSRPHIRIKESTSANWSGYAAATNLQSPATKSVTSVSGAWTVPTLSHTTDDTYSSIWVGIDGYASQTVEQIGTEQDWISGRQQNYAWFEMYPQGSYQIVGFPVNTGDNMAATVTYKGNNTFQLRIYNLTKRVYTTIPSSYTKASNAARSSAEWIVEAPSSTNGVLPLADFSNVSFSNCQATINGNTGTISNNRWKDDPLVMATNSGTTKAQPSSLTKSGANFSVTWDHE